MVKTIILSLLVSLIGISCSSSRYSSLPPPLECESCSKKTERVKTITSSDFGGSTRGYINEK